MNRDLQRRDVFVVVFLLKIFIQWLDAAPEALWLSTMRMF
jgi:hypothetical protein